MSAILQRPRKAKHRQSPGMCALARWGRITNIAATGLITAPKKPSAEADCSWIMAGGQSATPRQAQQRMTPPWSQHSGDNTAARYLFGQVGYHGSQAAFSVFPVDAVTAVELLMG